MSGRRYEVLGVVGRGSVGTVYHARMLGEGGFCKNVGLKVLHPSGERDIVELAQRLRDEARVLGLVSHRAIVGVDALVQLAGRWTVVMEYVPGASLLELTEADKPGERLALPARVAIEVVGELAGALDVAFHTRGPDAQPLRLLHRDLKPSNVRLTRSGEVKILDFGFAKAQFPEREARTRHLSYGSLGYVPHELLEGRESPHGDVYSAGVILYELLSGEPFGQTPMTPARHDRRLGVRLTTLRDRLPDLPPAVIDLVVDMVSFRPEERPAASDVEQRCTDLAPQIARPDLRQWAKRFVPASSPVLRAADDPFLGRTLFEDDAEERPLSGPGAYEARPASHGNPVYASSPVIVPARRQPLQIWQWAPLVGAIGAVLATGALLVALIGIWLGMLL